MRLILASLLAVACATPATAEVCDKMNERWSPAEGAVGQVGDLYYFITTPAVAILFAAYALCLSYRMRWLPWGVAVMAGLFVVFHIGERWFSDSVYQGAISEGCLDEPHARIAILTLICAHSLWRSARLWRRRSQ